MSIIAYPLEATKYTAEDVQSYLSTRTSGVYSDEITFTPEGMTVTVSPFLAWINYAKFKGCSVAVTEPETLTFSRAHAVLHRADRIVLRLDLTINKAYLTVLKGEESSYPVHVPDFSRSETVYDLCLATVFIAAGSTGISSSDISSELLNDKVCGIMRDGVTGIPTAQLQAQAEELILRLHDSITQVQDGSAFMIGSVYDPGEKTKPVAFDDEVIKKADKPSGSYKGNGSSIERALNVGAGIGNVLYITSEFGSAFVMDGFALCCTMDSVSINANVSYSDGTLYISTTNEIFNTKNKKYSYRLI